MLARPSIIAVTLLLTSSLAAAATSPTQDEQAAHVAAFARLYGAVRYFDPADALQQVDWNRFVVHGVHEVSAVKSARELGPALRQLFLPLASGVQITAQDASFQPTPTAPAPSEAVRWQRIGFADGVDTRMHYQAKRTHRPGVAQSNLDPNVHVPADDPLLKPEATLYPITAGRPPFVDIDLGEGWKARVPLALSDAQARITPAQQNALTALKVLPPPPGGGALSADQRQADIVVAWNVFRHFYPYWREVGVDWDKQLTPLLADTDAHADRFEHRDTLRHLVSLIEDGHGSVYDRTLPKAFLPLSLEPIEGAWVVTFSADPQVRPGDRIDSIDGQPASLLRKKNQDLASGTPQYRQWVAVFEFIMGPRGQAVRLGLDRGGRPVTALLHHDAKTLYWQSQPSVLRPKPLAQLRKGVWYVDVSRVDDADVTAHIDAMARARAVIVDLRGYPRGMTAFNLLRHLLPRPEHAHWMHVPRYDAPFQAAVSFENIGWDLTPAPPHFGGKTLFLADGRAISQADSLLGYVTDDHLATLVGSPSAGTNGDITSFSTPSRYIVSFTGTRVTRHDGTSPFHLIGAQPDIRVAPTLSGFRAGHDEVLQRALREAH